MKYNRNILENLILLNILIMLLLSGCKVEEEENSAPIAQYQINNVVADVEVTIPVNEPKCFIEGLALQNPKYNGNLVTKETLYEEEKLQECIIKRVIYNYDDNNKLLEEITEYDDREFRTVYEYLDE